MKVMVLADVADKTLWDWLDRTKLEGVELILACGDLPSAYLSFLTCFTSAPILYVHGNHDESYDQKPPEGCICIEDRIYVYKGLRIMGLGGSMRYRYGNCMYTEREMRRRIWDMKWKLLWHRGFDILVTHAPPRGVGDQQDLPHQGFRCFLKLMDRFNPKYMFHGHVHPEYGMGFARERQYGNTKVINGYKCYYVDI